MEYSDMPRVGTVSGHVDVACRRFDLTAAFEQIPLAIDHHERIGLHHRPVNAVRIDQVAFALLTVRGWPEGDGKVVADAFVKAQSLAQPERQGKLFAELRITFG